MFEKISMFLGNLIQQATTSDLGTTLVNSINAWFLLAVGIISAVVGIAGKLIPLLKAFKVLDEKQSSQATAIIDTLTAGRDSLKATDASVAELAVLVKQIADSVTKIPGAEAQTESLKVLLPKIDEYVKAVTEDLKKYYDNPINSTELPAKLSDDQILKLAALLKETLVPSNPDGTLAPKPTLSADVVAAVESTTPK